MRGRSRRRRLDEEVVEKMSKEEEKKLLEGVVATVKKNCRLVFSL